MNKAKRIISLILVAILLLSTLSITSCDRKFDEQEVIEAVKELLPKAEILNTVYYGSGIMYVTGRNQEGIYYEADPMHLESLGFDDIDRLKELTDKTFTVGFAQQIYETRLSSIVDDSGVRELARYYQKYSPDGNKECIMVSSDYPITFKDKLTYDYTTIKALYSKKDTVYLSIECEVQNSDGESQRTEIKIALIEEEKGWRIDNPVYTNYNEYLDKYEELEKNNK